MAVAMSSGAKALLVQIVILTMCVCFVPRPALSPCAWLAAEIHVGQHRKKAFLHGANLNDDHSCFHDCRTWTRVGAGQRLLLRIMFYRLRAYVLKVLALGLPPLAVPRIAY